MANEFIARNGLIAQNNSTVTGSLNVTGGITGSLLGTATTASYVTTAQTASYVQQAVSASYALTASYVANVSPELIVTNRQTGSYSLILSDKNKLIEMNVASANNLTIPLNSSITFDIGTQILLSQYGAGQTTILPTGGVTLRSAGGKTKLTSQYSGATLIKIATDEWYVFGDITA